MSTPTERGIIMTGESVRGILDGRKTQTRRVVKIDPWGAESYWHAVTQEVTPADTYGRHGFWSGPGRDVGTDSIAMMRCPYGVVGDRLWVRETAWYDRTLIPVLGYHRCFFEGRDMRRENANGGESGQQPYESTAGILNLNASLKRRPSILMPRWASRITLEITDVRVERLQDISESDAKAEGVERCACPDDVTPDDGLLNAECGYFPPRSYVEGYRAQWDLINGKRNGGAYAWETNCWVWVLTFSRVSA